MLDACGPLEARYLAARASGEERALYSGMHLSRAGNALVAEALVAWLRERYPDLRR